MCALRTSRASAENASSAGVHTTWAAENQTQEGEREILENSPQSGRVGVSALIFTSPPPPPPSINVSGHLFACYFHNGSISIVNLCKRSRSIHLHISKHDALMSLWIRWWARFNDPLIPFTLALSLPCYSRHSLNPLCPLVNEWAFSGSSSKLCNGPFKLLVSSESFPVFNL